MGEYRIIEFQMGKNDRLVSKNPERLQLRQERINVLSITLTDETYLEIQAGDTETETGDTLQIYGKSNTLKSLDDRVKEFKVFRT